VVNNGGVLERLARCTTVLLDRLLGGADPTATMSRAHAEIAYEIAGSVGSSPTSATGSSR
jgi:hypothetical protein